MGFEPTTPCLQSRCSSQLSYSPGGPQRTGAVDPVTAVTGDPGHAAGVVSQPVSTVPSMVIALPDTHSPEDAEASTGRLLFERLMARYERGRVEPMLELFAEDAEVLAFDGVRRGRSQIGAWLAERLDARGPGFLVSTDRFAEDGDVVRFEATVAHPNGSVQQVYGVAVVADGLIVRYLPGLLADLNGDA